MDFNGDLHPDRYPKFQILEFLHNFLFTIVIRVQTAESKTKISSTKVCTPASAVQFDEW